MQNLVSSVNALNYFADTHVSEGMRDSFKELIKEYENYNGKIVIGRQCFYHRLCIKKELLYHETALKIQRQSNS